MGRDAGADELWNSVYGALKRSGDDVPHTDRARPQVLRLSLLYALADRSQIIRVDHLRAALAVWGYCRDSARMIFGGCVRPDAPDPLWLQLLSAIRVRPGVKRGELTERFKHKGNAEAVGEGLVRLEANGLAYRQEVQPEGGGRPAECWYPSGSSDDTPGQPDPEPEGADPWVVVPEASAERPRQETSSAEHAADGDSFLADAGEEANTAQAQATGDSFLADAPKGKVMAGIGEREVEPVSSETPEIGPLPKAGAAVPSVEEVIRECFNDNPTPKQRTWAENYVKAQIEHQAELRRRRGDDEPPLTEEEFFATLRKM